MCNGIMKKRLKMLRIGFVVMTVKCGFTGFVQE